MSYIALNIYFEEDIQPFNTTAIVERIKIEFPDAIINKEDPLVVAAKKAEIFTKEYGERFNVIAEKLKKDVENFGPGYDLIINNGDGNEIIGRIRKYTISFNCPTPIAEPIKKKITQFLESLNVGNIFFHQDNFGEKEA